MMMQIFNVVPMTTELIVDIFPMDFIRIKKIFFDIQQNIQHMCYVKSQHEYCNVIA